MVMFYVTYPDKKEADQMIANLMAEKLIACGNIFPIESCYIWNDEIHKDAEYVSILKTSYRNAPHVESYIENNHSYNVPCIMRWEFYCNHSYEKWIYNSIIER